MTKIIIALIFLLSVNYINSQEVSKKTTIEIFIKNIKHKKGTLIICATEQPDRYLKNMEYCQSIPVNKKGQITTNIKNLSFGKYAIVIYHDKNDNGKLDLGLFKIPKEPYGFSNNPSTLFGPPNFEKASFIVNKEKISITISL